MSPLARVFGLNRSSVLVRYGVAALAVTAAALLYAAIDPLLEGSSPFIVFTVAVMISAWFGGLGPGIFASILGWIVGDFFWVEPFYTLRIVHAHELVHTMVFMAVGVAISLMSRMLEKARSNAVAANRAKDHFLAVLSHELRNPLAPVLAAICDLEQVEELPRAARENLEVIRRNVNLQTRLIDDLLDVNRLSRGKLPLRWDVCGVHEVLGHALEVCRPEAAAKGVTLHSSSKAEHDRVRGDPARLQQVFWNLLRNAIKFTPAGGSVSVETSQGGGTYDAPGETIRIRVQDTGIGIAEGDLARIFEPFEQGSADTPRRYGGMGLGLALSKALVGRHGGKIGATSEGPGRGSKFWVELPTTAAVAEGVRVEQIAAAPSPTRILLVEDDTDAGPILARLLRRYGYDVTLARSRDQALGQSRQSRFDLVISDVRLPDGSGIDLFEEIRASQNVRGICLSGFGADADLQESRRAGFERHLIKPVDPEALRKAIEDPASTP